ncbi:MAG: NAD-dependent epimerase/dehydratase family protein [Acidobacteria bacterium]|nr:NAD-dependent epimerase/dehydratase family protein [Acidobacteriota bacterium]
MRIFVTGAAGFIGSSLVDRMLAQGHQVVGFDNFSTGQEHFLQAAGESPNFRLVRGDLLEFDKVQEAMAGADLVVHFAANADVRHGTEFPRRDLEQNTIVTWNVLEAMRRVGARRIAFSSTGSIYGEPTVFPTPENSPFPVQTSLYGASKLAAEGLIQAYSEGFGFEAYIFRFVSILGERYTHGHVVDFVRQLNRDAGKLHILGNGEQRKSYLYVQDCLNAIEVALNRSPDRVNIFNLGTNEYCRVIDSAGWICERMGVQPQVSFEGGERGWIGDSPFIFLDCSKIRSLGWAPRLTVREAVVQTVDYLTGNAWLLEARP